MASEPDVAEVATDAVVYQRHAPELIRFATALVGPTDAADVLSAAVVKALASPRWPLVHDRRAYLYRAVFNAGLTHQRRKRQRPDRERRADGSAHWDVPNLDPEVRDAVLRLSVRQRAVIVLTYWLDLDPAAVAGRLGISEGAVRRHLARARAQLREVLR
ncbi:MAG: RNA polymerase sigma factor [Actinomycetota bacterium]|nr:RNA polymerase sigma factor [Actinomycetota bacterium]